jgi:hypothetical protein
MSASVTRLPTARTSYFTVAKSGKAFAVQLVTPGDRSLQVKDVKTTLAKFAVVEAAIDYATDSARRQQLPLKLPSSMQPPAVA